MCNIETYVYAQALKLVGGVSLSDWGEPKLGSVLGQITNLSVISK